MRSKANPGIDKALFSRTAKKSKAINVLPMHYRGGIRL